MSRSRKRFRAEPTMFAEGGQAEFPPESVDGTVLPKFSSKLLGMRDKKKEKKKKIRVE